MASIGESVFCHGGQLVASGKAQTEDAGFESVQTQYHGSVEKQKRNGGNRKSSCP